MPPSRICTVTFGKMPCDVSSVTRPLSVNVVGGAGAGVGVGAGVDVGVGVGVDVVVGAVGLVVEFPTPHADANVTSAVNTTATNRRLVGSKHCFMAGVSREEHTPMRTASAGITRLGRNVGSQGDFPTS